MSLKSIRMKTASVVFRTGQAESTSKHFEKGYRKVTSGLKSNFKEYLYSQL